MSGQAAGVVKRKVYVGFQGGGARGIVHIGALRAIEASLIELDGLPNQKVQPVVGGVAGTSAGSIVAALVACGYGADSLLDRDSSSHLLKNVAGGRLKSLSDLFTKKGWKRIKRVILLLKVARLLLRIAERLRKLLLVLPIVAVATLLIGWFYFIRDDAGRAATLVVDLMLVASPLLLVAGFFGLRKISRTLAPGLAPLSEVRSVLDEAFSKGPLPGLPKKASLTFEELHKAGGLPLKVISTNLSNKCVQVFCAETTPKVAIADAVCASISLPYIFEPYEVEIAGVVQRFSDGGALSNLPLWAFDGERARDPECWTIGFSLRGDIEEDIEAHWLGGIVDAVIKGPPEIHARGISNLMIIPLSTSLTLLDFDKGEGDIRNEVDRVAIDCAFQLDDHIDAWRVNEYIGLIGLYILNSINTELVSCSRRAKGDLKIAFAAKPNATGGRSTCFHGGYALYEKSQRHFTGLVGMRPTAILASDSPYASSDERWWLPSSHWAIAFPLVKGNGLGTGAVVIIESSDLTEDDICGITGEGQIRVALAIFLNNMENAWASVGVHNVLTERVMGRLNDEN